MQIYTKKKKEKKGTIYYIKMKECSDFLQVFYLYLEFLVVLYG